MDKSYGENKRKFLHKNKFNKKKQKYHDFRDLSSRHSCARCYTKSYLNSNKHDVDKLYEFNYPLLSGKSYAWWDDKTRKPKVFPV
jgi:hypothetical protein